MSQVGLDNKCVLPAIGFQEMKHLPAEERRVARYRPMKFSVGHSAETDEVLCVFCVYGSFIMMGASGSHVVAWSEHVFVLKITF